MSNRVYARSETIKLHCHNECGASCAPRVQCHIRPQGNGLRAAEAQLRGPGANHIKQEQTEIKCRLGITCLGIR